MGRRKSVALQKREYDLAVARENYYRTRPASTITTVQKRETDKVIYASSLLKSGAASSLFSITASSAAVAFFGGETGLGLRLPSAVTDPVAPKPRNFTPAKVSAMQATATPTAKVSPWGSRVIKYSTATAGTAQAHYSAPISIATGVVTYDLLDAKASAIFTAVKANLGDLDYARFSLSPERFNNSKN
jgi:Na+/H+ antiporter NhaC